MAHHADFYWDSVQVSGWETVMPWSRTEAPDTSATVNRQVQLAVRARSAPAAAWVLVVVGGAAPAYARSLQADPATYEVPAEQLMATVRSPFVQTLAAAGEPEPAAGNCEQAPGVSWKDVASTPPTLENVTSTVWLPPGRRGVAVPPYLLIVVHVELLVALSLEKHVAEPEASLRITALAVAAVLVLLPMTALVHDDSVPLLPSVSSAAATAHATHTSGVVRNAGRAARRLPFTIP